MPLDALGRPPRDLRISVTDRCNFRCPYCMPAETFGAGYSFLPRSEVLSFEEIERLTRVFTRLGVTKVRLTGGEPLLRQDLPELVRRLAAVDGVADLALTTNGSLLADRAEALARAGLRRITVSLDSLDEVVFRALNGGRHGPERVLDGIRAAEESGLGPVKINTVVQRGVNDAGILDLARRFRWTGHVVRFIEYMDVGNLNGWAREQVVPAAEVAARINAEFPIEPVGRAYRGEVAGRYRYVDGAGEFGLIASVTRPFCGDCTRARLSTDGRLYTCLFATSGTDLRGPLRAGASDEELLALVAGRWSNRDDRYSERRAALAPPADRKVEMYQIGG